jgi:hypothetical protein
MEEKINVYEVFTGKPEEKCSGKVYRLDLSDSEQGQVADYCENSSEPSGYIKGREFLN